MFNETKNSQRRTHTQQVLFAETTLDALILSTQGTKRSAQFCLQRQHLPHRSENLICLETTFTVLFLSTIAAQQNKFLQFSLLRGTHTSPCPCKLFSCFPYFSTREACHPASTRLPGGKLLSNLLRKGEDTESTSFYSTGASVEQAKPS
jgi:hypothetical protein